MHYLYNFKISDCVTVLPVVSWRECKETIKERQIIISTINLMNLDWGSVGVKINPILVLWTNIENSFVTMLVYGVQQLLFKFFSKTGKQNNCVSSPKGTSKWIKFWYDKLNNFSIIIEPQSNPTKLKTIIFNSVNNVKHFCKCFQWNN